jgi:hypothetical protein
VYTLSVNSSSSSSSSNFLFFIFFVSFIIGLLLLDFNFCFSNFFLRLYSSCVFFELIKVEFKVSNEIINMIQLNEKKKKYYPDDYTFYIIDK